MMSVNAPPPMLISSTPPFKSLSRLRFWRKVTWAEEETIGISGESSRLSLTTEGSSINAAFGGESATGVGTPEFDVTQSGVEPCAFVATHPAGSAGGVTPSKFSLNDTHGPRRRTVACLTMPKVANQLTACTNPVVGFVNWNVPLPEASVVALP
jgi:hypothetical protein